MSSVVEDLENITKAMRDGSYAESEGAVLITRDARTGILTFNYPGLKDEDEGHELLKDAMESLVDD